MSSVESRVICGSALYISEKDKIATFNGEECKLIVKPPVDGKFTPEERRDFFVELSKNLSITVLELRSVIPFPLVPPFLSTLRNVTHLTITAENSINFRIGVEGLNNLCNWISETNKLVSLQIGGVSRNFQWRGCYESVMDLKSSDALPVITHLLSLNRTLEELDIHFAKIDGSVEEQRVVNELGRQLTKVIWLNPVLESLSLYNVFPRHNREFYISDTVDMYKLMHLKGWDHFGPVGKESAEYYQKQLEDGDSRFFPTFPLDLLIANRNRLNKVMRSITLFDLMKSDISRYSPSKLSDDE